MREDLNTSSTTGERCGRKMSPGKIDGWYVQSELLSEYRRWMSMTCVVVHGLHYALEQ